MCHCNPYNKSEHLKKIIFILISSLALIGSALSQERARPNYDSLWYFHPFSVDLLVGVWTPVNNLSEYYYSGAQFGAGFSLMTSKKTRIHLLLMPRILKQRSSIFLKVIDSTYEYSDNTIGASIGGWMTYNFYRGKIICPEIITGLTWEDIPTNILKENKKDTVSISGLGLSIGINSWFNTFNKLNFGLRAVYTYSTFDNSKYLAKPIGGHSLSLSLVYRFANRDYKNKKWY